MKTQIRTRGTHKTNLWTGGEIDEIRQWKGRRVRRVWGGEGNALRIIARLRFLASCLVWPLNTAGRWLNQGDATAARWVIGRGGKGSCPPLSCHPPYPPNIHITACCLLAADGVGLTHCRSWKQKRTWKAVSQFIMNIGHEPRLTSPFLLPPPNDEQSVEYCPGLSSCHSRLSKADAIFRFSETKIIVIIIVTIIIWSDWRNWKSF